MEHATTWRASLWARWLGWTLVFGLVFVASSVVSRTLLSVPVAVFILPTYVAAFLIGMRFRSWSWLAGPAAVVMVLFMAAGLTTGQLAVTVSDAQAFGASPGVSLFLLALVCLVGGGFVYAVPALVGVWCGKRGAVTPANVTGSSLGGDATP